MKISSVSDSELSKWIAEKLDQPVGRHQRSSSLGWEDACKFCGRIWSEIGFTICHLPRDMVNDPAMTVMLMEKLAEDWQVFLSNDGDVWDLELVPKSKNTYALSTSHKQFKRVLPQGYALSQGWVIIYLSHLSGVA